MASHKTLVLSSLFALSGCASQPDAPLARHYAQRFVLAHSTSAKTIQQFQLIFNGRFARADEVLTQLAILSQGLGPKDSLALAQSHHVRGVRAAMLTRRLVCHAPCRTTIPVALPRGPAGAA